MSQNVLLVKGNYLRAAGPETVMRAMLEAMNRKRFEPVVVMLRKRGVAGAPILEEASEAGSNVRWREVGWPGIAGAAVAARGLARVAREEGAAIIHTHDMRANLAAYLLRKITGFPWVAHMHGWLGPTHTRK